MPLYGQRRRRSATLTEDYLLAVARSRLHGDLSDYDAILFRDEGAHWPVIICGPIEKKLQLGIVLARAKAIWTAGYYTHTSRSWGNVAGEPTLERLLDDLRGMEQKVVLEITPQLREELLAISAERMGYDPELVSP